MQLSHQSHVGIFFDYLFSGNHCTEEKLNNLKPTPRSGVSAAMHQAGHDMQALVGLSTSDELFGLDCLKKVYVITKRAKEVIEHITVSKLLPIERIQTLLKTPRCICFSPDIAYFVWADADGVKALFLGSYFDEGKKLYGKVGVDLAKVYEVFGLFDDAQAEERDMVDGYKSAIKDLIRILIFLELTEPEILVVPAGKKYSQAPMGYSNSSPSKILIVDSTWNKFIVRTDSFGVRGHFRMQPCGEANQDLKLIWIDAFQKTGYVRKPKAGAADPQ